MGTMRRCKRGSNISKWSSSDDGFVIVLLVGCSGACVERGGGGVRRGENSALLSPKTRSRSPPRPIYWRLGGTRESPLAIA